MEQIILQILVLFLAVTVEGQCPSKLTCTLKKREMCTPGNHECGPCKPLYEETPSAMCVLKTRSQGSRSKFMGPDTMIDYIHNLLNSVSRVNTGPAFNPTSAAPTSTDIAAPLLTSSASLPLSTHNATGTGTPSAAISATRGQEGRVIGRGRSEVSQTMSLTLIVICSLTGFSGILVAALCWYRLQKEVRLAQKMAYTAYKGSREHTYQRSTGHVSPYVQQYQNQKQQLRAQERSEARPHQQLSTDSEPDIEEFTIYECPGLAPTGEMEVHNPLFDPLRTTQ
ncbi:neural proliferation differentiation and control protein 1-like isoform 2-T2 [Rhinophrynus dorsalis]